MLDHHILSGRRRSVVVKADASVVGLLTLQRLREVPQADWPKTTVKPVMISATRTTWVRPDMDLAAAMGEMDRDGVNQLPVMRDGTVLGMLARGV
jgi:CBS domain-containing protein